MRLGGCPVHFGVDDHLNIGDVRQRVERDSTKRPDACKYQRQHPEEQQEAIRIAPIDSSFDHCFFPHMEPPTDTSTCLVAIVWPSFEATIVRFQAPPPGSSTFAAYVPFP
jgi:hypothetical protein